MNISSVLSRDALYPEEIVQEASVIAAARANRIQTWIALGLSASQDPSLITARSYAAVDNLQRRSSDSGERLRQIITRCSRRAQGST